MQIGDKVIIKECHHILEVVGQEAEIVGMMKQELVKNNIILILTMDLTITRDTPFGQQAINLKGMPLSFREEELTPLVADNDIPDAFKHALDGPQIGTDGTQAGDKPPEK